MSKIDLSAVKPGVRVVKPETTALSAVAIGIVRGKAEATGNANFHYGV